MSEPTGDGKQQPDPAEDQVQDQVSGSDFGDPTAPVWVDPTVPVPPPLAPPGAASPYGQQPAATPQAVPQSTPPVNNPYAQQPYPQQPPVNNPYAQQPPVNNPYAKQPPAPPYGEQPPAYGQQYYATGASTVPSNTSAIILTIVSGVSLFVCNVLAIASLVLGIVALTRNATDPVGSRRLSKIGWIVFACVWALGVLILIAYIGFFVAGVSNSGSTFGSGY